MLVIGRKGVSGAEGAVEASVERYPRAVVRSSHSNDGALSAAEIAAMRSRVNAYALVK